MITKALRLFASMMALCLVLTSCGEKAEAAEEMALIVTPSSLSFSSEDSAPKKVNVTTNVEWTAVPDKDWVTVTPSEDGKSFSVAVETFTASSSQKRTATVTVSTATYKAKVSISQSFVFVEKLYENLLTNIRERTIADNGGGVKYSATAKAYMGQMNSDGAFPDIDYKDTGLGWIPSAHITRLLYMALAYADGDETVKGNADLQKAINSGVLCWYTLDPKSTNWWWNEISWPQNLGAILCLMHTTDGPITKNLETMVATRALEYARDPSKMTGANKQDLALAWLYSSILLEDKTKLTHAVEEFFQPLQLTTDEGIQHDYSFQQHGKQLYMAGYGSTMLTAYLKMAFYLAGTSLENKSGTSIIRDFLRYGYVPLNRGSYILFAAGGRGHVSRNGALNNAGFASQLTKMAIVDPEYADFYTKSAERISGRQTPDYGLEPMHYHFWRTDYSIHQRLGYTMDFRTASKWSCRAENGNTENLKGYFLCDGCSQIVVDGNEYYNIFPVWNWTHIPGTTVPDVSSIPLTSAWGVTGQSAFTGGVSDGMYGCSTYQYTDKQYSINSSANKGWFCFDDEIVCMGNSIKSANAAEMHTTVNQTLLKGNITAEDANGAQTSFTKGTNTYSNLRWLSHNKVCYCFPEDAQIKVDAETKSGTWYAINNTQTTNNVSSDVFLAYINHGAQPEAGKYCYYVLPNQADIAAAKAALDKLSCLNEPEVQAVYNEDLHIFQAVFYAAATAKIGEISVTASAPCCLMITGTDTAAPKLSVSDPAHKTTIFTIKTTLPGKAEKTSTVSVSGLTRDAGKTSTVSM